MSTPSNLEDMFLIVGNVGRIVPFKIPVSRPELEEIESYIQSQYIPREEVLKALEDVKKVYRLDSHTFDVNLSRHLAYIVNGKVHEIKKELNLE